MNLDSKMENDMDCKTKDAYRRNKRCKRTHQDGTVVLDLERSRRHASKWRSSLTECYGSGLGYRKDIAALHARSRS